MRSRSRVQPFLSPTPPARGNSGCSPRSSAARDRRVGDAGLRIIHGAPTEEAALDALEELQRTWDGESSTLTLRKVIRNRQAFPTSEAAQPEAPELRVRGGLTGNRTRGNHGF